MFIRGQLTHLTVLFRQQRRRGTERRLQEVSQGSSQHKSWSCCPSMQTVRSINVQELRGRTATVLQPFSLSQAHNPDPPAEVSTATASTVLVALMSSQSNSFPSSLPNPAVCWETPPPPNATHTYTYSTYTYTRHTCKLTR